MKNAREGLGVVTVNGKIYAIGGGSPPAGDITGTNEEYDSISDTWRTSASMPTPRSYFGIAVVGNKIYCIGGWTANNETNVIEVYNTETNSWETKKPMPLPRYGLTANTVGEKIYVIGGNPSTFLTLVYDPETDTWTIKTRIPVPVAFHSSAVLNNKIYIMGGYGAEENLTQIYDPETDTWTLGAKLYFGVHYATATATTGTKALERIYLLGGIGDATYGANQIYNPQNDSWSIGETFPTPRILLGAATIDDKIYVIGGSNWPAIGPTSPGKTNESYVPAEWIPEFPTIMIVPLVIVFMVAIVKARKKLIT